MSMPSDADIDQVLTAKVAARLAESPKFMAWVISKYKEFEGIDDHAVARKLGLDVNGLNHLALSGRPRDMLFTEDLETIATRHKIDQLALAELVRRVEAVETFRTYQGVAASGLLAAARDRAAEESGEYDAEPDASESTPPPEPDDEQ